MSASGCSWPPCGGCTWPRTGAVPHGRAQPGAAVPVLAEQDPELRHLLGGLQGEAWGPGFAVDKCDPVLNISPWRPAVDRSGHSTLNSVFIHHKEWCGVGGDSSRWLSKTYYKTFNRTIKLSYF